MRITILTLILLILFTVPVNAGIKDNWNSWSETDRNWQIASTVFISFDIYQTIIGIKNGSIEIGGISSCVGERPTAEQMILWGLVSGTANYCIARISNPKFRRIFQITTIGFEYDSISRSYGTKLVLNIPIE